MRSARLSEDILAMIAAGALLLGCFGGVRFEPGAGSRQPSPAKAAAVNAAAPWVGKPGRWAADPREAWRGSEKGNPPVQTAGACAVCLVLLSLVAGMTGESVPRFALAMLPVLLLAAAAFFVAQNGRVHNLGLEYALWALAGGLLVANTAGTPGWMQPALRGELFIKTGLVLMGAELLLGKLLALGLPGIFVAWVVTPIVLLTTFWFGQRVLRIQSPSLNIVISADMSVCGVSAAIATAAACRAKKEELSLAIGLSLGFTVLMMVAMPPVVRLLGLGPVVGGAWIGGTIDSSGAVAAAGAMLGDEALHVATTVKLIQNMLIGLVALGVAIYWSRVIGGGESTVAVGWGEVWRRFPKFVLGFLGASVICSMLHAWLPAGPACVEAATGVSKLLREWLFCLAFVSIGLTTNIRTLAGQMAGGRPLVLYVCGQSLNLALTLAMAWLMYRIVFPTGFSTR